MLLCRGGQTLSTEGQSTMKISVLSGGRIYILSASSNKLQFTTYEIYELLMITMCLATEFTYNLTTECNKINEMNVTVHSFV